METISVIKCSDCNVDPVTLLAENVPTEELLKEEVQL